MAIVLPRHFDVLELGLENDRDSTFCLTKLSTERTEGGKKSQLKEKFGHVLFKQETFSITSLYDVTTRNDTEVHIKMAIVLPRHFDVLELGLENDRDSTLCLMELSTDRTEERKKSQLKEKFGHVLFQSQTRVSHYQPSV
uniref:Uncharacterized protein n=1 Tax=Magallana gigas TaxID=29159 RepID=A0A8W8IAU0_MAGGI